MHRTVVNCQTGKITKVELTAEEIAELQQVSAPTLKQQRSDRASAYAAEADPLFFKSQRGEATTAEWEAKVAEIKARYPYPDEA